MSGMYARLMHECQVSQSATMAAVASLEECGNMLWLCTNVFFFVPLLLKSTFEVQISDRVFCIRLLYLQCATDGNTSSASCNLADS